jgi:predicted RNase H-like HicB family nuclease
MRYVYPAVFEPDSDGGYCVYFPDIKRGATQGNTIAECIEMAEDFLCLALYNMEEEKQQIPSASEMNKIGSGSNDIVTLISVDTESYRRYYENRLVKKTLNIPSWLNEQAERANVNFSQTLQKALKQELSIAE